MKRIFLLTSLLVAVPALAQTCTFSACPASHPTFMSRGTDGSYVMCGSLPNWLGHRSHARFVCPAGSSFSDVTTGTCRYDACTGCGGELPLCDRLGERFWYSSSDTQGQYAVCQSGPTPPGMYLSHRIVRCVEGWTLQPGTGQCRKDCLVPDLAIRHAFLRNTSGSLITSVRVGQPYLACFEVVNQGRAWASTTTLRGGGLGVSVAPSASVPALSPDSWTTVCLSYPTTPSVGTWGLGGTVNTSAWADSDRTNDSRTVTVRVVP
jgi:hypothetical protein